MLALSLVLPQIFHLTGIAKVGEIFLPMHIPVLITGFILGPVYGLIIGAIAPILSCLVTGMPLVARLPFMIGELAVYGLMCGLLYQKASFFKLKFGTVLTLVISMIAGRASYALMLLAAAKIFKLSGVAPIAAVTATTTGLPGIVLQLIVIPPIIYSLKKGGLLSDFLHK